MQTQFTTPEAAEKLGISPDQFRNLVRKRDVCPVDWYDNPHYRSGPKCPLWSARSVANLARTNDLKKVQSRKKPDPIAAKAKRMARFARKYPTLEDALPNACDALFWLNRYAKHRSCSQEHQEEIYGLKNKLIRILFQKDLADRTYQHVTTLPEKECFYCFGGDCERCGGTGVYEEARELVFVVFSFMVDGTRYTWHQPSDLVDWPVECTEKPSDWELSEQEKPVEMSRNKFAEAKDLLRFTIQMND